MLVHVIKRISNEFSLHTIYCESRVFYIPRQRLWDIKQTICFIEQCME